MTRDRITARCAADLANPTLLPYEVSITLAEKLHRRTQAPEVGDLIDGLRQRPCYSIHAGRYRGATWFDAEHDVLWLLAAGLHSSGDLNDFYNVAVGLEQAGQLYPMARDYADLATDERRDRLDREAAELRALRDAVVADPQSGKQTYTSGDGLYTEMWGEVIEELALVAVRVRMFRSPDQWIGDPELAILLDGALGTDHHAVADVWPFWTFEAYIPR